MQHKETGHLALVKGGKVSPAAFGQLPLAEKLQLLATRPTKEQLDLILSDPAGHDLVEAIPPFRLYLLVKEIGEEDSLELIHLASSSQLAFMLDLELWQRWKFQHEKGMAWLERLVSGGEAFVAKFLEEADIDLLVLLLSNEIDVGGGLGTLLTDDERLEAWDHTFDQLYYISFKKGGNSRLTGTFLDILHRQHHPLYLSLMERIKVETLTELQDICFHNRSGRLADQGFPEYDEALPVYAYVDPSSYKKSGEKRLGELPGIESLPMPQQREDSLLGSIMRGEGGKQLAMELNYLVNNLLVLDQPDFSEHEEVQTIMERAWGYVTIALEHLSGADRDEAAHIARQHYLKDLFRLGFSLVLQQSRRASRLTSTDYATGKLLAGLKVKRPQFFRGLDPDHVDAYREFRALSDVEKTAHILDALEG